MGAWCLKNIDPELYKTADYIVAEPFGRDFRSREKFTLECRDIENRLFKPFYELLNSYHSSSHGERFWKIILGHWFRRSINVLFNRLKTVEWCVESHQITGLTIIKNASYSLATVDSESALWAYQDPEWNDQLLRKIIENKQPLFLPVEIIEVKENNFFHQEATNPTGLKHYMGEALSRFAELFSRDTDGVIINSYLPKFWEIKLYLCMFQFPQFRRTPQHIKTVIKIDSAARSEFANKAKEFGGNELERFILSTLFEMMPVAYFEGFKDISTIADNLNWPKSPSFIFTSNNFDTDEVFKLWAAKKVELGFPYLVGQHGNNYGTYRYSFPEIEEVTADKFLRWGNQSGYPTHRPAFIFKTLNSKKNKFNKSGGLLLIQLHSNTRQMIWDDSVDFAKYLEDQMTFVRSLNQNLRNKILVRLSRANKIIGWNDVEWWNNFDPEIKLEAGVENIRTLVSKNRLVVHGYDSTGILETLSLNVPTMAFWAGGFEHLLDSAKPAYQLLVDAGIIHFSPQSIAAKINEVWDSIDSWWYERSRQDAIIKFCNLYAKDIQSPILELKKLLTK